MATCIVMVYIVMAYVVMAYIGIAHIVMAYLVMATNYMFTWRLQHCFYDMLDVFFFSFWSSMAHKVLHVI